MEQIHAKSYSTIFTTVANTTMINETFEWVKENKYLQRKISIIDHIYTNIMELWNTKHFIPKRLSLLENISESLGYKFSENTSNIKFDPKYEMSIKKPPIFILDNFESISNFISKLI
jgi:ribonucleotide reductase beta subunit family protein with ferritin-like domain